MRTQAEYDRQIRDMANRLKTLAGYGAAPLLVWKFPKDVMLIMTISDALESGMIEANESANKIIRELVAEFPRNLEPTVFMLRVAWSAAFGRE